MSAGRAGTRATAVLSAESIKIVKTVLEPRAEELTKHFYAKMSKNNPTPEQASGTLKLGLRLDIPEVLFLFFLSMIPYPSTHTRRQTLYLSRKWDG